MDASKGTRIKSGKYELVLSEQILMDSLASDLVIDLVIENTHLGILRITFSKVEGDGLAIKTHGKDGGLIIECINFDDRTEVGTVELIPIGTVQGRNLKLHLWTKMMGSSEVRKVEINLYKE